MSKRPKRTARVGEDAIVVCPGCGFTPIRESWLEPCPECGVPVCSVCRGEYPEAYPGTHCERNTSQGD